MSTADVHAGPNGDIGAKDDDKPMEDVRPTVDPAPHVSEIASPTSVPATLVDPPPPSLTDDERAVLASIAAGTATDTQPPWEDLKSLSLKQFYYNVYQFMTNPPPTPPPPSDMASTPYGMVFKRFPPRGPPSPRSTTVRLPLQFTGIELKEEEDKITEMFDEFDEGPPFTMQRLAELLLHPFREYRMLGNYMRAIARVLSVTPAFDADSYVPAAPPPLQPAPNAGHVTATPFQLASTPLFSPIPFLQGKELPTPTPRHRSASPPLSPLDIGPRRSPHLSPRGGSPRLAARRGGPRVATSSAAMSAQTRRRANSQSSPTSPTIPMLIGSRASFSTRTEAVPIPPPSPYSISPPSTLNLNRPQRRSPSPSPKSPPTGPTPTRVDELDNPDAHRTMLDEPVALSSVTTGKVKVRSPEMRPADIAGIMAVVAQGDSGPVAGLGLGGLGLDLGERFVPASSTAEESSVQAGLTVPKVDKGKGVEKPSGDAEETNGSGDGEEGEVERMVSEEPEMEEGESAVPKEALGDWEIVEKDAKAAEDVQMSDA